MTKTRLKLYQNEMAMTHDDRMIEVIKGLTEKQWDKLGSFDDLYNHVMKVMRKELFTSRIFIHTNITKKHF